MLLSDFHLLISEIYLRKITWEIKAFSPWSAGEWKGRYWLTALLLFSEALTKLPGNEAWPAHEMKSLLNVRRIPCANSTFCCWFSFIFLALLPVIQLHKIPWAKGTSLPHNRRAAARAAQPPTAHSLLHFHTSVPTGSQPGLWAPLFQRLLAPSALSCGSEFCSLPLWICKQLCVGLGRFKTGHLLYLNSESCSPSAPASPTPKTLRFTLRWETTLFCYHDPRNIQLWMSATHIFRKLTQNSWMSPCTFQDFLSENSVCCLFLILCCTLIFLQSFLLWAH